MKLMSSLLVIFVVSLSASGAVPSSLAAAAAAADVPIDYFFFFLEWPGSYCNSKEGCCFPKAWKPVNDFTIAGLRPFAAGDFRSFCSSNNGFNTSKFADLNKRLQQHYPTLSCPLREIAPFKESEGYWSQHWRAFGTCSEPFFPTQHQYFGTTLLLKHRLNILHFLQNAGIKPNGSFYKTSSVINAIKAGVKKLPRVECNLDKSGNSQLYQIQICVDTKGTKFLDCPASIAGKGSSCGAQIKFSSF